MGTDQADLLFVNHQKDESIAPEFDAFLPLERKGVEQGEKFDAGSCSFCERCRVVWLARGHWDVGSQGTPVERSDEAWMV